METIAIIICGVIILFVIVVLGIIFSGRNPSKKEKTSPPIEVPEKEYSEYNGEEVEPEDDMVACSYCGKEVIDGCNDSPVCDDYFKEIDGEDDEYDDRDYSSGFSLPSISSIITGIIVLGITITLGGMILNETGKAISSSNISNGGGELFGSVFEFLPIMVIVAAAAIILGLILTAFNKNTYDDLCE